MATGQLRHVGLSLYELHSCKWLLKPRRWEGMRNYRKIPSSAICPHKLPWRMSPLQHESSSGPDAVCFSQVMHVWVAGIFSRLPINLDALPNLLLQNLATSQPLLPLHSLLFLSQGKAFSCLEMGKFHALYGFWQDFLSVPPILSPTQKFDFQKLKYKRIEQR